LPSERKTSRTVRNPSADGSQLDGRFTCASSRSIGAASKTMPLPSAACAKARIARGMCRSFVTMIAWRMPCSLSSGTV
jgi:hypothetical protein